ncbi:MAG: Hpt domain-containing protein [Clostridia bacterium]
MDNMLAKLKDYGADIDGTMARFLDDVDLYKSCFAKYLQDEAFDKLGRALSEKDYKSAFEYAHTLKGITGNMGLTPLYSDICNIVEALRETDYSCLLSYYTEVLNQLKILRAIQE